MRELVLFANDECFKTVLAIEGEFTCADFFLWLLSVKRGGSLRGWSSFLLKNRNGLWVRWACLDAVVDLSDVCVGVFLKRVKYFARVLFF